MLCPPKSQHCSLINALSMAVTPDRTFMLTPFFFTILTFNPIVGHVSDGCPMDKTFRSVVLPLPMVSVSTVRTIVGDPYLLSRPTITISKFLLCNVPSNFESKLPISRKVTVRA